MIRLFHTTPSEEEIEIVAAVLRTGNLVMGRQVNRLEKDLEDYLVTGNVVTCASGTDALIMALEQMGCEGHGVIVPAMTFSATYEAVLRVGAMPILADVDQQTLTPSIDQIRATIAESVYANIQVSAVILVHLYGWPAYDTEEIAEFCKAYNIVLIEDCAQAFGARVNGRVVGTFGDAAAYSFYPTKPLAGIGDGGAALFRHTGDAESARVKRNHGRSDGVQVCAGYNSRLDEVNAAVIRHRLYRFEETRLARMELVERYNACGIGKLSVKRREPGVPYVYPILTTEREQLSAKLALAEVETRVHYDPAISGLPYVDLPRSNADWAAKRVLSLPCHEYMALSDVDKIADIIRA